MVLLDSVEVAFQLTREVAQGQIVGVEAPSAVDKYKSFNIVVNVKNTGTAPFSYRITIMDNPSEYGGRDALYESAVPLESGATFKATLSMSLSASKTLYVVFATR